MEQTSGGGGLQWNPHCAGTWPSPRISFIGCCGGSHHVPSSQTLIWISTPHCVIASIVHSCAPAHTCTLTSHREHRVQTRGGEVKSIVHVRARVHLARLVTLLLSILLAAILDPCMSVHYVCPHVLMTLSWVVLHLRNSRC